jgi:peroxiredoxin
MVDYDKFEALNVQVIGIGASNPFSQKTFAASLKLPYPLLSDYPDLEVIRKYGVLNHIGEAKRPVAKGSYFLIDKQGVVRGKWMHPKDMDVFPSDPFIELAQQLEGKS